MTGRPQEQNDAKVLAFPNNLPLLDQQGGLKWQEGRNKSGRSWHLTWDQLYQWMYWKFQGSTPPPMPGDPGAGLMMHWHGQWEAKGYTAGSVVRDELWTMVANKDTSDVAAPILDGTPEWMYQPAPSWATNSPSTTLVVTGVEFNLATAELIVSSRFYIPAVGANLAYHGLIREVLAAGEFRNIFSRDLIPLGTGWLEVNVQGAIFEPGKDYQMLLLASDETSGAVHQGRWDYNQGTQNNTPNAGEIYFRTSTGEFRVHGIDDDGTNHATELDLVTVGSVFSFANGAEYTVTQIISAGPLRWEYVVSTSGTPAEVVQDVSFTVPVAAATDYVTEAGYFTTNPPTNGTWGGLISTDGSALTKDDNAYGVELQIDGVTASPDWDVVALSQDLTP